MEMEPDEVSSEVREMNSVDALVENTAINDTHCFTELNNVVRNYNERYCACKYILLFGLWFCATGKPKCLSCGKMICRGQNGM